MGKLLFLNDVAKVIKMKVEKNNIQDTIKIQKV